jgi:hypothetical protein
MAAVRVTETDALAALATMDIQPVDDPLRELSLLAGEALGWKKLLRDRVAELTSLGYAGATGEQTRATVQLYGAALDRLERILVSIARLDIDTRLAAITERQAEMHLTALEAGLAEAGITGKEAAAVKASTGRHLRLAGRSA